MPDIRDIVGQTSALEKIPQIDQRNQEMRAGKLAINQDAQNVEKQDTVHETKETQDKIIRKEGEHERKREEKEKEDRTEDVKAESKGENTDKNKEPVELKGSDVIEVEEGKIVDVKV